VASDLLLLEAALMPPVSHRMEGEIMNDSDNRRARRFGLAVAAAAPAAAAIILATASSAAAAKPLGGTTHESSASVANGTLTVRGTNGADHITLRPVTVDGVVVQVQVFFDGIADGSFFLNTFNNIDVLLGNGNDQFDIDPASTVFPGEQVTVNGGNGNDILRGGGGAEIFIGGNGRDFVDGNGGSDTADLGTGNDTFRWDPGDGSDTIDGGTGTDTLDFRGNNAAEIMELSPVGTGSPCAATATSCFTRDLGNIVMTMNRVERLNLVAGGGADTITINDMSGTGFRRADVDPTTVVDANFEPTGAPDGLADTVTVNGTDKADHIKVTAKDTRVDVEGLQPETRLNNTEPVDTLDIQTGGGNDTVKIDPGVFALIGVSIDGIPQP
jgi:Ca2+-binding RTX toxin-like protein